MKFITHNKGLISLFLLSLLLNSIVFAAPNTRSPLGINSNEVMDDDASIPFIDIFKTSLPFEEARPWLTKGKIEYDQFGWPKNLHGGQVGTRFLYKLPKNTVPEGLYTVLYDGEGILTYSDDAKLVFRESGKDIIKITAGRDREFRVKLVIKHSNPANYLRNIRVLLPGGICANNKFRRVNGPRQCRGSKFLSFEKNHEKLVFNPDYLNYMKDFKVIRFMNMSGITRNPISRWEDRPRLKNATWAGKQGVRGAPLEIMVALANMLNADPWFNIPHKANNNYVRRYAQYVKTHLKPGLKAYVEYTNEAWNTIFDQAHYVKNEGERLGLDSDRDKAGYKYFSMRSVQIFDMWEQTFGGTSRIVRVMGSWAGWTRMSEMLLTYRNAYKKTDAVAIAPYFFPSYAHSKRARSVSQLFKMMYDPKEKYSIPSVIKYIKKNADMAKKFGIDLIAYEGGQHLVDWKSRNTNSHPTKLFIQANKDMRMAKAYTDFLRGWKKNGGKLFVNFSAPRTYQWFGSWGTKEYITQPISKAPKHRALLNFSRRNPCWWQACNSARIARFAKPANNPLGDVFTLVKSKPRKNKKTVIAKAKSKPRSTIGTRVPNRAPTNQYKLRQQQIAAANARRRQQQAIKDTAIRNAARRRHAQLAQAQAIQKSRQYRRPAPAVATNNQANNAIWNAQASLVLAQPDQILGKRQQAQQLEQQQQQQQQQRQRQVRQQQLRQQQQQQQKFVQQRQYANRPRLNIDPALPEPILSNVPPNAIAHRVRGDGNIWQNSASLRLANIVDGKILNGRDLSAVWQSHWDDRFLYVRVDTVDDMFVRDSETPWSDDSIELYIDADGSRSPRFDGKNDFHFIFRWKDQNVSLSQNSPHKANLGIRQTMIRTDKGYTLEAAIPWRTLGVNPVAGRTIGIDVQINDDDSGKGRDGKLAWYSKNDNAWKNPQNFGRVLLGI